MVLKQSYSALFLLTMTVLVFGGCAAKNETATPTPEPIAVISSSLTPVITHTPWTENSSLHLDTPQIVSIDFPDTVQSASEGELGEVYFSDAEGDIYSVQFTLLEGGCMDFEYFAFDPMAALSRGDRFSGAFRFRQTCRKCPGSTGDLIRMRVQFYDRAGNESLSSEYAFLCQ